MSEEIRSLKITTSKDNRDYILQTIALCKKICLIHHGQEVNDSMALKYICDEFNATYGGPSIIEEK
jgi:hypothetical protein